MFCHQHISSHMHRWIKQPEFLTELEWLLSDGWLVPTTQCIIWLSTSYKINNICNMSSTIPFYSNLRVVRHLRAQALPINKISYPIGYFLNFISIGSFTTRLWSSIPLSLLSFEASSLLFLYLSPIMKIYTYSCGDILTCFSMLYIYCSSPFVFKFFIIFPRSRIQDSLIEHIYLSLATTNISELTLK